MKTKLRLLAEHAMGKTIQVRLNDGSWAEGELVSVEADGVVTKEDTGEISFFAEELIQGWKMLGPRSSNGHAAPVPATTAPVATVLPNASSSSSLPPPPVGQLSPPPSLVPVPVPMLATQVAGQPPPSVAGAEERPAEITETWRFFSDAFPDLGVDKSPAPALPLKAPDFKTLNLELADDKGEFLRVRNMYAHHVLKMKTPDRLARMIPDLVGIARRLDLPEVYLIVGQLAVLAKDLKAAAAMLEQPSLAETWDAQLWLAEAARVQDDLHHAAKHLLSAVLTQPPGSLIEVDLARTLAWYSRHLKNADNRDLEALTSCFQEGPALDEVRRLRLVVLSQTAKEQEAAAAEQPPAGAETPPSEAASNATALQPQRHGKITSITYDLGCLVDADNGRTFYFVRPDVPDVELREQLGHGQAGQKVLFHPKFESVREVYGRPCPLAIGIEPDGELPLFQRWDGRRYGTIKALEKSSYYYQEAKRAEKALEFDKAIAMFRSEISSNGMKKATAVKDLAHLLNRLERSEDAIRVLDEHGQAAGDSRTIANIRVTILIKAGMFEQAIRENRELIEKSTRQHDRATLHNQTAYFLYRLRKYDDALRELTKAKNLRAGDPAVEQLIKQVQQAKEGIISNPEEDTSELHEFSAWMMPGLSSFARFHLDQSKLEYVDERSKASKAYSEADFNAVELIMERIRGRRPQEKGQLRLTLARLCQLAPTASGKRQIEDQLCRAFCFFGEAAVAGADRDTARAFLAESLSLGNGEYLLVPLSHLISAYFPRRLEEDILTDTDGKHSLARILPMFLKEEGFWHNFVKDFPYYAFLCPAISPMLDESLKRYAPLLNFHPKAMQTEVIRESERLMHEREKLMAWAKNGSLTTSGQFIHMAAELNELRTRTRFKSDDVRLRALATEAGRISDYWVEGDVLEKDRRYASIGVALDSLRESIESQPTRLSLECILPLTMAMKQSMEENFAEFKAELRPAIELKNVIEGDSYVLDGGEIDVRIELASRKGGCPIESLELRAVEEAGLTFREAAFFPDILRGGERCEFELRIKPSPQQIADEVFDLGLSLKHTSWPGTPGTYEEKVPIRLVQKAEFEPIQNHYAPYSTGTPIEDKDDQMFKGREALLARIVEVLSTGQLGQCFALHGQKRSGKTSVLNKLKLRFEHPCLAVSVTVGAFDTSTPQNFYRLVLDEVRLTLERRHPGLDLSWWPDDRMILDDTMLTFQRTLRLIPGRLAEIGFHDAKLILLVDEFTYLHEYIRQEILDANFMRGWKAMLQMELFSAVVFGQDTMPEFIRHYPNEFGALKEERLTYLTKEEAAALADQPIWLDGKSRYRGRALERLLELTAGSPFFLQIMCNELVLHINARRSPWASEADVEAVLRKLTFNREALPLERFDPLISAAGEVVALACKETYLTILRDIANYTGRAGALLSELPNIDNREAIIDDMLRRQVISRDENGRLNIVVKLFEAWLRAEGR